MTSKEIRKRLDEADNKLLKAKELLIDITNAIYEIRVNKEEQAQQQGSSWVSVEKRMPDDDKRVVVRTKDGATYFLHPINGKFPADIKEWYELPQ